MRSAPRQKKRWEARQAEETRQKQEAQFRQLDEMPPRQAASSTLHPAASSAVSNRDPAFPADQHGRRNEETWPLLEGDAPLSVCGAPSANNPCHKLLSFGGMNVSTIPSFEPFFHRWFLSHFFPAFSTKLKQELQKRANAQGFLNGLTAQFRSWAMSSSENLHSDVWYAYMSKKALPPQFRDYCCFRTASVNLGSQAGPCWVMFWGFNDSWSLVPWANTDVDTASLMDELESRGGWSALFAAAA